MLHLRFVLLIFCLYWSGLSLGQTKKNKSFYLRNVSGSHRSVQIKKDGYIEFVKYYPICNSRDSSITCETRIRGEIKSCTRDSILIHANVYNKRSFDDLDHVFYEQKSITGGYYTQNLSLSEIDGVYYSSPFRLRSRNAAITMLSVSLFTGLVIAPLVSLEYKSEVIGGFNGFNRKQYFAVAGSSMALGAISFTCYVFLKPKYYSFSDDDYKPRKKRWTIITK